MVRAIASIALAVLSSAAHATTLDRELVTALAEQKLAGIVYATVALDAHGEPEIRTGAAGVANLATGERMRPGSHVQVGSVAKTLVALGVLRLVTEGRVALDTPVAELVPAVAIDNPWPDAPLRVRHLLDHTGGLDDARLWQVFGVVSPDMPLAQAYAPDRVTLRLRTRPGTTFSYSNMGYGLAAMVIEAVTRERYETWLDANLLAPLAMDDSTFAYVGADDDAALAAGHHDDGSTAPPMSIAMRAASQLTTSARDMGRLAAFLLRRGTLPGMRAPLVDPALLAAMARPTGTDAALGGLDAGYALGLATRDRHGVLAHCHGGNVVGYRAQLCLLPASRKAFFTSINSDSESADYNRFDALLIDALGVPRRDPADARGAGIDASPWLGRYVPAPGRFATFEYLDLLGAGVVLAAVDGAGAAFELRALGVAPRPLHAAGGALLRLADRVEPTHVMLRGAAHVGNETLLLSDGQRTYRRVAQAWYGAVWAGFVLGVAGLAWFALAAPIRGATAKESVLQPGTLGTWLLLVPLPFLFAQPFVTLGERTVGSTLLYAVLALLPLAMLLQLGSSWRHRRTVRWWRAHALAALAVLQWCATLSAYDLLPFALWR